MRIPIIFFAFTLHGREGHTVMVLSNYFISVLVSVYLLSGARGKTLQASCKHIDPIGRFYCTGLVWVLSNLLVGSIVHVTFLAALVIIQRECFL